MNSLRKLLWGFTIAILLTASWHIARAESQPETIKGYVLDSACAFTKNLKKPISAECAVACAKAGSPLVILTDNGAIYWPISDAMPAQGQNARLMEFAGRRVAITGKVYQHAGSRAVVITAIRAEK